MIRKYFAEANTSDGFVSLLENNLSGFEVIQLSSTSRLGASRVLEKILSDSKTQNIECIMSPFNIKLMRALIFPDKKIAVLIADNGTDTINLGVSDMNDEQISLRKKADDAYAKLYETYKKAKDIHDDWEKIYNGRMDFERLTSYGAGIINQLIPSKNTSKAPCVRERFFGASTPDGSVNYIDNLTERLSGRFFIKGRPGTGKSTFLKKLAKSAQSAGFDTEIYYCSFDKKSLDMVLVPELGFCVFDSTAPHELFPSRPGDRILDFYEESGLSGTDEECAEALAQVSEKYRFLISEGVAFLRLASLYEKQIESIFKKQLDDEKINTIASEISKKV